VTEVVVLQHIGLEKLQELPDDALFYASFSPTSAAHPYVMCPELRAYVHHHAHTVHGSWIGGRQHSALPPVAQLPVWSKDAICSDIVEEGGCHHRVGNHPECQAFTWITVLCGDLHGRVA